MATLDGSISPSDSRLRVSGDTSGIRAGYRFRLDDEALELIGFGPLPLVDGQRPTRSDPFHWIVRRGLLGTAAASHDADTVVVAIAGAYASGEGADPPSPFSILSIDGGTP